MENRRYIGALVAAALLFLPTDGFTQVVNGNFDSLSVGWVVDAVLDSSVVFTSVPVGFGGIPWSHVETLAPCGDHTLMLRLRVTPGNNAWAACLDNVSALCGQFVPVVPTTWGRIKALYGP